MSRGDRRQSMKTRGFECVTSWADENIHLPERKTASSAGYDIEAGKSVTIASGESVLVPTGIKAYMQPDEVLAVYIRSSLGVKKKLVLTNTTGIIDADYYNNKDNEGHIYIALWNRGEQTVSIQKGERIAQGIFQKYLTVDGDKAGDGVVRQGGFGSTGKA